MSAFWGDDYPVFQKSNFVGQDSAHTALITTYGAIGDGSSHPVSQWLVGGLRDRGYANLEAIQVDYPHVISLNDEIDWAAIQKASDILYNNSNSYVDRLFIPVGQFMVNRQIVTGDRVALVGMGQYASRIWATPAFLTDAGSNVGVLRLSRTLSDGTGFSGYEHNNGINGIHVNCNGNADIGVEVYNMNENACFRDFYIMGWLKKGIVAGSASAIAVINYCYDLGSVVTDVAVDDSPVCIHIAGGNHPLLINRITCIAKKAGGANPTDGVGILISVTAYLQANIQNCHFERLAAGIRAAAGRVYVSNCDGYVNTVDVVHFTGGVVGWAERITNNDITNGRCVKDSTDTYYSATPIRIGTNTMESRYACNKNRTISQSKKGFGSYTTDASGNISIDHGLPIAPKHVIASILMGTTTSRRELYLVGISDTTLSFRVYDYGTSAYANALPVQVSWSADL